MQVRAVFAVWVTGAFVGCGEDPIRPEGPFQQTVTAAAGGTITAGGATLSIPAGALAQDTTISVVTSSPTSSRSPHGTPSRAGST